jgi:four helix bundle protein
VATFNRFEDIIAWQKARELTRLIYQETAAGGFEKDYGLRDQIRRAGVSIMANIAEGHGRLSDKEFANFLNIARGSAMEVKSHLYVALDLNLISKDKFDDLYARLDEVAKMIFGLIRHLKQIK